MHTTVARTRALMTETERSRIAEEVDVEDRKRYQAITEVRNRINEELTEDVKVLKKNHPELLKELQDIVCENGE